ncbi:MAG: FkbM family methyltransferase [Caldimonas sp.]
MKTEPIWDIACALVRRVRPQVVFDVGAHQGHMSRLFLDALPGVQVHAFEPQAALRARLCERFAGEPRLRVVGAALGDREGTSAFHEGVSSATSSRFPRNLGGRRYYRSDFVMTGTTEVRLDSVDAYCAREGVAGIDLLKLDTQGGEHAILRGAAGLLGAGRIAVIVSEFFAVPHYEGAPLLDEIWGLLRSHGYGLFDLHCGPHAGNGQLRYGDAIFVSPGFRSAHLDNAPAER